MNASLENMSIGAGKLSVNPLELGYRTTTKYHSGFDRCVLDAVMSFNPPLNT